MPRTWCSRRNPDWRAVRRSEAYLIRAGWSAGASLATSATEKASEA